MSECSSALGRHDAIKFDTPGAEFGTDGAAVVDVACASCGAKGKLRVNPAEASSSIEWGPTPVGRQDVDHEEVYYKFQRELEEAGYSVRKFDELLDEDEAAAYELLEKYHDGENSAENICDEADVLCEADEEDD